MQLLEQSRIGSAATRGNDDMGRFYVLTSKGSFYRNACDGTGGLLQQGRCRRAREQGDLLVANGLIEARQQCVKN